MSCVNGRCTRSDAGDQPDAYFSQTEKAAGVCDMRFQPLSTDVLHGLGVSPFKDIGVAGLSRLDLTRGGAFERRAEAIPETVCGAAGPSVQAGETMGQGDSIFLPLSLDRQPTSALARCKPMSTIGSAQKIAPAPPNQAAMKIATAGWSIPRAAADRFPAAGSALSRYASQFDGVEINSTFYRSHRPSTYARWRAETPAQFRFAVKLPRTITHKSRLVDVMPLVTAFRNEVEYLSEKLGPLLVQLPPSLAFDITVADTFFAGLRGLWPEAIVCEPRHGTWFDLEASKLLCANRVGRVASDPARHPAAATPGGWDGIAYWRLHGSPRMYYSPYGDDALHALAEDMSAPAAHETWCVFDNTASGAAVADALRLQAVMCGLARGGVGPVGQKEPADRREEPGLA
jgi:uncharacterized protein YecE (DUF72 family)